LSTNTKSAGSGTSGPSSSRNCDSSNSRSYSLISINSRGMLCVDNSKLRRLNAHSWRSAGATTNLASAGQQDRKIYAQYHPNDLSQEDFGHVVGCTC